MEQRKILVFETGLRQTDRQIERERERERERALRVCVCVCVKM